MRTDCGFSELQARFDTEAVQFAGLRCWAAFGSDHDLEQVPRPKTSSSDSRVFTRGFGPPNRLFEFWCGPAVTDPSAAIAVFEALATQAGDRMLRVPRPVLQELGFDAESVPHAWDRWLQFVLFLGWKAVTPSLRVPRSRPFDRSLLNDPDSYSSEVADIFVASAAASQWIADQLSQEARTSPARQEHVVTNAMTTTQSGLVLRISHSEQLTQLGIDCAAMIAAHASSWSDAARWLTTLPICWATTLRHFVVEPDLCIDEPWLIVGLNDLPINSKTPKDQWYYVYDNEPNCQRRNGPILRRLVNAWNAATHRFLHEQRGDDQYFDFGIADAQRIALLAALTFNADFNGAMLGFDWPWDHPADCEAALEGRRRTWVSMTAGLFAETTLVEVIGRAVDYLHRMPNLWQRSLPAPEPATLAQPSVVADLLALLTNGNDAKRKASKQVKVATGCAYDSTCAEAAKKKGKGWTARQIAKERAEDYVRNHPYPGLNELARRSGCGPHTMTDAIESSDLLKRARAAAELQSAKPARRTNAKKDASWPATVDEAMRTLIESATEAERARLNTPEMRQQLDKMEPDALAALVDDAQQQAAKRKKASMRARARTPSEPPPPEE